MVDTEEEYWTFKERDTSNDDFWSFEEITFSFEVGVNQCVNSVRPIGSQPLVV